MMPDRFMPIDLTTLAADVLPPSDRSHEIFQFPTHSDFPDLQMSDQQFRLEFFILRSQVKNLEARLEALEK